MEGEKVFLRAVEAADAERVQRWVNAVEGAFWPQVAPGAYSRRSQETWLTRMGGNMDSSVRLFAIDTTDARHIGLIQLWQINWIHRRCNLALLIGEPDYRGRGYEEDAVRTLTYFAFQTLNLHRVQVSLPDLAGARIQAFRDAGFVEEARLTQSLYLDGAYHDTIILRALAGEWQQDRR